LRGEGEGRAVTEGFNIGSVAKLPVFNREISKVGDFIIVCVTILENENKRSNSKKTSSMGTIIYVERISQYLEGKFVGGFGVTSISKLKAVDSKLFLFPFHFYLLFIFLLILRTRIRVTRSCRHTSVTSGDMVTSYEMYRRT